MLASLVTLHDIDDVEGFVCATIERSGLRNVISQGEREELIAEGILILYELAERFEPQRDGYDQPGRFSGFAAQFLPRRLGDAWHSRNPEHRRVTGEDGKRRWVYSEAPLSLNEMLDTGESNAACVSGSAVEAAIRPYGHWAPVPAQ